MLVWSKHWLDCYWNTANNKKSLRAAEPLIHETLASKQAENTSEAAQAPEVRLPLHKKRARRSKCTRLTSYKQAQVSQKTSILPVKKQVKQPNLSNTSIQTTIIKESCQIAVNVEIQIRDEASTVLQGDTDVKTVKHMAISHVSATPIKAQTNLYLIDT